MKTLDAIVGAEMLAMILHKLYDAELGRGVTNDPGHLKAMGTSREENVAALKKAATVTFKKLAKEFET